MGSSVRKTNLNAHNTLWSVGAKEQFKNSLLNLKREIEWYFVRGV